MEKLLYSQTPLIRTLLIRHFRLIRGGKFEHVKSIIIGPNVKLPS